MTLAERAHMATAVRVSARIARQRELSRLLAEGMPLKRAAHAVGWSYRSARRWRKAG
ncbi:helix-turn-helix domain-containing protein [Sphingopyxis sp. BSN-002]|uniref:helix-turn-helix domain-containing protein n=1 Tax=Sphingopyxis sp. BSN-002 TaxID=2911495 RepID=UPI001EDB66A4|nr:helix-turn-helix domain-containing protein [Sphingopyxis sp. BSN-002]UKK84719.1 helix-turn-helix domain-containing protein [Sphingopyxis sp. BSN-002]